MIVAALIGVPRARRRHSPTPRTSRLIERGRYLAAAADCAALPHRARTAASLLPAVARSRRRSAPWSRPTSRRIARPASAPGPTTQFDAALRKGQRRDGCAALSRDALPLLHAHVARRRPGDSRLSHDGAAGAQRDRRRTRCRSRSTSARRCAPGTRCISTRENSTPTQQDRRMESRRLSRRRARTLRRVPHAEIDAGRRSRRQRSCTASGLQGWFAPDITNDATVGLGRWSVDDIAGLSQDGAQPHQRRNRPDGGRGGTRELAHERRGPCARLRRISSPCRAAQ